MLKTFRDTVSLITGASSGIGAECARRLAAEGSRVVLVARSREPLEALAKEIGDAGGEALAMPADVSDAERAVAVVNEAREKMGRLDLLVNNAGANRRGPIENYEPAELAHVVAVNLVAPIVMTRAALPYLREGGGAVVNVASIAGRIPVPHEAVYSATKFGLRAFGFALEEELEGSGVTVSAVSPGPVETGFITEDLDHVPDIVFAQPMSTAGEIADLVLAAAKDGDAEKVRPWSTGALANLGYLFPPLTKVMRPLMEPRGRAVKAKYRAKQGG